MKKVAVIGAGPSGLCSARHLSRYPETFQFTVYEKQTQVGGTWVYQNDSPGQLPEDVRTSSTAPGPHSSTYRNLRTNIPKEIMFFPDFPMEDNFRSFPSHYEVCNCFKRYCEHYHLSKFIQFKKQVEQVLPIPLRPDADSSQAVDTVRWSVTVKDLTTGEMKSEEYDYVLVCSGHFSVPDVPDFKGLSSFPRPVLHSHLYREPEPFAAKSVLVIGTGPSGEDLLLELSPCAKAVYLCTRSGPLLTKVPANVEQLPGITEFKEDGRVCFENGDERTVDCVVLATGYVYSFPFLSDDSGIKVEHGKKISNLYKHTFNVAHPSLAIPGMFFATVPLPGINLQVQWILAVWRGEKTLPSEHDMFADVEETYQKRLRQGLPPYLAGHYLEERQWEVFGEFASGAGLKPLDHVVQLVYEKASYDREHELMVYRSKEYEIVNEESFRLV